MCLVEVQWRCDKVMTFTGDVYTDGSCKLLVNIPAAVRAGWGVAIRYGLHRATEGLHGTFRGFEQSIPRAPFSAILMAVKHTEAKLMVHIDRMNHVKMWKAGRAFVY